MREKELERENASLKAKIEDLEAKLKIRDNDIKKVMEILSVMASALEK